MIKNKLDEKIDISIVVLHYNDYELTVNYVNNIQSLNWDNLNYKIIIVDNCSPDGGGNYLKTKYIFDEYVDVIISPINLGFAKGNNLGICFANENYHSDLIVVSNNDIQIQDYDFFIKLWSTFQKNNVAIIGPDIYSTDKNIHQSPINQQILNKEQLLIFEKNISKKIKYLRVIKKLKVYNILSDLKRCLLGKSGKDSYLYDKKQYNVVLQGAFFVLTKKYLNKHPEGLYPGTFLYMEELILFYICFKENLDILYDPELKVLHFDGVSTRNKKNDRCDKYLFEMIETLKSCNVFEKVISEYERGINHV